MDEILQPTFLKVETEDLHVGYISCLHDAASSQWQVLAYHE